MAGYEKWSPQQLIARIQDLEAQLKQQEEVVTTDGTAPNRATFPSSDEAPRIPYRKPPKQPPKAFDASRYSTRLIALKFAYLGQKYNGFEHHKNNSTPLPTIEEELWKALVKTRLISPILTGGDKGVHERVGKRTCEAWDRVGADVNWDGCEYSKCGRTDRGVSAFGQVIGVRVRSNKPLPKTKPPLASPALEEVERSAEDVETSLSPVESETDGPETAFDDTQDELPYIQLLNRVLPPDIRIYAWCPNPPPNFSARFSCKERRYKYFFTNPCFAPVPGPSGQYTANSNQKPMREGWLDIDAMKKGCRELVGLHDFRNLCKIDASKQLTNFKRRIFHADIEEISPLDVPSFLSHPALSSPTSTTAQQPKMYAFVLHGSAFLWHQVRSIIAILFLIGQGLEAPSLIPQLLDIATNPMRPKYEMASDAPLVLWDCIFPHDYEVQSSEDREHGYEDRLNWIHVGDEGGIEPKGKLGRGGVAGVGRGKWGRGGVLDDVWEVWRAAKMEETLSALLLDTIAAKGTATLDAEPQVLGSDERVEIGIGKAGPRVFDGGDLGRAKGNYMGVMERERQESVEVVNERYAMKHPHRVKPKEDEADE